ncbi:hypothetical protein IW262DRAFT_1301937 [Armillaria fumosa]|nr:hypothetical protein IW262DRAFT_1301937 [Armillaria fumosa]
MLKFPGKIRFLLCYFHWLKLGEITGNAAIGMPFTVSWYLEQGDDPDKLHLEQRLTSQNPGDGKVISFSFPNNGIRGGTVAFVFATPECVSFLQHRNHVVEAFDDSTGSIIVTSDAIAVSGPGTNTSSISALSNNGDSSTIKYICLLHYFYPFFYPQ